MNQTAPQKFPSNRKSLEQYNTPVYAAHALVAQFFGDLGAHDAVIEPSCGEGAFLGAIPSFVRAVGVEIDPIPAAIARENTGREVICGDFSVVPLPIAPTAIIGNPPFNTKTVHAFLRRAYEILPEKGRCGFILPAHALGYTGPVLELADRWSISQSLLPKSLFPRLAVPIVFATFCKLLHGPRTMVGFCLYEEAAAFIGTPKPVKLILTTGRPRKNLWRAVVEEALYALGGKASLQQIYAFVEGRRPRVITTWRDTIRRVLQEGPFERTGAGEWALA